MDAVPGLALVSERFQAGADDALQVGLPRVDHVDHAGAPSEVGPRLPAAVAGIRFRRPGLPERTAAAASTPEGGVLEVAAEQAELPELVGDVLADVGHRAVGADDHLVGILKALELLAVGQRHDPAAGVLAALFEPDGAGRLQLFEGRDEEIETEDLALVGKEVVVDADARHRGEMPRDDPPGDQPAGLGPAALSRFQCVEGAPAELEPLRVAFVPAADLAVEVPADVVEGLGKGLDVGDGAIAEIEETDHHVGHLDSGVVDVVLDFGRVAETAERPRQHIAQDGVPQVADVRRLVGIDVRVLDDHLGRRVGGPGLHHRNRVDHHGREPTPGEVEVHVARAFDRHPLETLRQLEALDEALRDRPRRLAQLAREVQGAGTREVAQATLRRYFDHRIVVDPEDVGKDASQHAGDEGSFALQHRARSL